MGDQKPDFSGWASVNDQKCSDGRTIMSGAFAHMDKKKVPLVWQHQHNDPGMVLGHAILENRAFGVFCHGYFNGTEAGLQAKEMVKHKDVEALSIFANNLNERRVNAVGTRSLPYRLAAYVISAELCALGGYFLANLTGFVSPSLMSWMISGGTSR